MSNENLMFESCSVLRKSNSRKLESNRTLHSTYIMPASMRKPSRCKRSEHYGKMDKAEICRDERFVSSVGSTKTTSYSTMLYNLVIIFVLMNFTRTVDSVPATVESLDSKIKTFLESRCTMQNQTLEQEEFRSFMSCGPSHGAGIVKNLGQIPEYKSDDTEQWARATKREIISQCEAWPQDRSCQEKTFGLIEKCFEKDQKFVFYFMFALTDLICQTESELFVKFWQNGGDTCLVNHIKSMRKDFTDCFAKTSTVSNADVYRNYEDVMKCFRSQFDNDCFGDEATQALDVIMDEIKRVYRETNNTSSGNQASFSLLFLTGWTTFVVAAQRVL